MEALKSEKHELFSQLKKVLHQEDETKKKAQLKEQKYVVLSLFYMFFYYVRTTFFISPNAMHIADTELPIFLFFKEFHNFTPIAKNKQTNSTGVNITQILTCSAHLYLNSRIDGRLNLAGYTFGVSVC